MKLRPFDHLRPTKTHHQPDPSTSTLDIPVIKAPVSMSASTSCTTRKSKATKKSLGEVPRNSLTELPEIDMFLLGGWGVDG